MKPFKTVRTKDCRRVFDGECWVRASIYKVVGPLKLGKINQRELLKLPAQEIAAALNAAYALGEGNQKGLE